ncbi:(R)-mandelonitrile lyase [Heracleum sosnowskyi]|uniref:(R)-mandelonitrile lyase n=1 Tax=Heracleum sosnowskyi TaxID=360622 RepID=A0AAD8HHT7_9APIA|nr:(R)-mandelonitrile lyase [Heracleum sosnowskyi]
MVQRAPENAYVLFLLFLGLWGIHSAHAQDLSYLKFVQDATTFSPQDNHYDYIVVGGGTAGCPLAATLSENYTVLLIERGGDAHSNPNVMREENLLTNALQINDKDSPSESFTSEDGIPNIRGRVLGGSSMVNFGIYSRGDPDFYNRSGVNWDFDVVKRAYEWVEETVVFRKNELDLWQSSVKEALLQSDVTPYNGFTLDHEGGTKITSSTFDATGRRYGAVELLNKGKRGNLQVVVNATVEKVLFTSNTTDVSAVGVIYKDSNGRSHQVQVGGNGEVILSAGALGSPQLLLVSGVGPSSYLASMNIPVVHHQPFVGQFMIDPPMNMVSFLSPFPIPIKGSSDRTVGIQKNSYIIEAVSAVSPFFSPVSRIFFPYPYAHLNITSLSIVAKTSEPMSSGSLKLASKQTVSITPTVRFNYFADPRDLSHCISGMQTIGKMIRNPIMDQYKFQDKDGNKYYQFLGLSLPENLSDRREMESFCRRTVAPIYHYHGGCTMKKVTDIDFKVTGIKALRVVDGSTFVVSPGTNPQATLMMMGRYVGLKMKEERMHSV